MRQDSLRLLQQAVRINPSVKINVLSDDEEYGEALVEAYAPSGTWSYEEWDAVLGKLDADQRTLGEFMDSPEVRTLIRAQEAAHANA